VLPLTPLISSAVLDCYKYDDKNFKIRFYCMYVISAEHISGSNVRSETLAVQEMTN